MGWVITAYVAFSSFGGMWTLVWPFTTIMFPPSLGARVGGLMTTIAQFGAAAAPVIEGAQLRSTGSYVGVFAAALVGVTLAFVGSVFLRDRPVVNRL